MALFSSLDLLQTTGILFEAADQWAPLQTILKAVSFQVEPVNLLSAAISYQNSFRTMLKRDDKSSKLKPFQQKNIPRKFRLHINQDWA